MKINNRPKGTRDIYPPKSLAYQKIRQLVEMILSQNNFQPIIIPTYEYTELFNTSLGSTTDIIHKEMFNFTDRKGRNLALRPEGTQGRYREFWQLGVELVNVAGVMADYQILKLIQDILERDKKTQEKYKQELKKFLAQNTPNLCSDCQRRINDNPLRILDCNSYNDYWQQLKQILETNNFPFQYDNHLVRGLDYYTGLVFEINLGAEKSLVGGGRYDRLAQELSGVNLPAIGFAVGIDRLVNYYEEKHLLKINKGIDIFFLNFNSDF
ncbi:16239_t:CDS:2 [Racocetra fulgida]|uniref:histidine--tRNA ligase n=1 Tax=Racocetra fulgida TaxID=60492 RepID=A0A9N9ESK2_9GLOM|nr:16239_t:CDS:2 [Racocetra fulgida]